MLSAVLVALAVLGGTAVECSTVDLDIHSSEGIRSQLDSSVGAESAFHADALDGWFHSRKMLTEMLGAWMKKNYPAETPAEPPVKMQVESSQEDPIDLKNTDTETPETTAAADAVECGVILFKQDFVDENIAPSVIEESDHACQELCMSTKDCDAYSRIQETGMCYRKKLPVGFPTTPHERINSYKLCPDEILSDDGADALASESADEFVADSRSNPHPDSTPHPEEMHVMDDSGSPRTAADIRALEQGSHAWFDYQIAGAYNPSLGTLVVDRDWFYGKIMFAERSYSICYINAFQTQADCPDCAHTRPDFTSEWPAQLVLKEFEDPNWPGEYLIDISTPAKRTAAAAHVHEMSKVCEDKLFDAVEFDNLDSYLRFENLPFSLEDTVAYAKLLVDDAHSLGLAAAQKNAIELIDSGDYKTIGFDFVISESCGKYGECAEYMNAYDGKMVAVEFSDEGFTAACGSIGEHCSVVQRDVGLAEPESASYVMKQCGP